MVVTRITKRKKLKNVLQPLLRKRQNIKLPMPLSGTQYGESGQVRKALGRIRSTFMGRLRLGLKTINRSILHGKPKGIRKTRTEET